MINRHSFPFRITPAPLGSSNGRKVRTIFLCGFTNAAFYREPPRPCLGTSKKYAVRYAFICPKLSLAIGRCGNLLRAKTPTQSSPVFGSGIGNRERNINSGKSLINMVGLKNLEGLALKTSSRLLGVFLALPVAVLSLCTNNELRQA